MIFFKRWSVIVVLGLIGLALLSYVIGSDAGDALLLSEPSNGVVPQGPGDSGDIAGAITAVAGAVTTLGAAVFGLLGKWTDYRKAQLEVAAKELEQKRQAAKAE
ncbi:hypothetical protein [uncultured Tateyamaria sp.]|uniref:hypothetical protein n=1 Tax=uncultured Tateyamaria sp. TaxID=455651 RepID=UPI00261D56EF|nr:hypothetical protein [uncultured Tateyamaria sp.]